MVLSDYLCIAVWMMRGRLPSRARVDKATGIIQMTDR